MKLKIEEYDKAFWISLEAETMEDAANLVRIKKLTKKEPARIYCSAYRNGSFSMSMAFSKKQDQGCSF